MDLNLTSPTDYYTPIVAIVSLVVLFICCYKLSKFDEQPQPFNNNITPAKRTFALDYQPEMDEKKLNELKQNGFSVREFWRWYFSRDKKVQLSRNTDHYVNRPSPNRNWKKI